MGAQKIHRAQKLLTGHDASASLRHPQMAPGLLAVQFYFVKFDNKHYRPQWLVKFSTN